jgi:NurA domain
MPVDITQLRPQLHQMTERSGESRRMRAQRVSQLQRVFTVDFRVVEWQSLCSAAATLSNNRWNGAQFNTGEAANEFLPFGEEPADYVLIATDGSQIMPDRHKAVQYAAIQVAATCIIYGQSQYSDRLAAVVQQSRAKPFTFLGEDELYDESVGDLISPGEISTERDLRELEHLAEQCEHFRDTGLQPIAVADGSIVPFTLLNEAFVRGSPQRARELLNRVVSALDRMRASQAIVAGYIDRPNSNAVARSCSLINVPSGALNDEMLLRNCIRRCEQNLRGITDRQVLAGVLLPWQRTAMFEPAWLINGPAFLGQYGHTMHCCYMNVGTGRDAIARLEVPAWCADPLRIGIMTKVMTRHALMGGGYPLCLKAAHEEAVLSHADERRIDLAIERELIAQGVFLMPSSKQEAKDRR